VPLLDLSEVYTDHEGAGLPTIEVPEPVEPAAYLAVYRVGVQSMKLAGLPSHLQVGRVLILQTQGPVLSQRTEVVQRPEPHLTWDKAMFKEMVGAGLPLTICHLPVFFGAEAKFSVWRGEVLSALGLVVALLDDRIAQREVFEDFVIVDESGFSGLADSRLRIRNFLPLEVRGEERDALSSLEREAPPNVSGAARWYLRAAQLSDQQRTESSSSGLR
jgi:hypothetical protein